MNDTNNIFWTNFGWFYLFIMRRYITSASADVGDHVADWIKLQMASSWKILRDQLQQLWFFEESMLDSA